MDNQKKDDQRILDILSILGQKDMIKSTLTKRLNINGSKWTYQTVCKYVEYMKECNLIDIEKIGRVCKLCLTEKGRKMLKNGLEWRNGLR